MAYLKANAPLYFYIALLNSVIGAEKKTSEYIFELRRRHIEILLPCVNHSTGRYLAEGSALSFSAFGHAKGWAGGLPADHRGA